MGLLCFTPDISSPYFDLVFHFQTSTTVTNVLLCFSQRWTLCKLWVTATVQHCRPGENTKSTSKQKCGAEDRSDCFPPPKVDEQTQTSQGFIQPSDDVIHITSLPPREAFPWGAGLKWRRLRCPKLFWYLSNSQILCYSSPHRLEGTVNWGTT